MATALDKWLISSLAKEGIIHKTDFVLDWINIRSNAVEVAIEKVRLQDMRQWRLDKSTGSVRHISGGFFSLDGMTVKTDFGPKKEWGQPIINQAEIGILGCIVKEISGVLHFLVQAKIEPGNINLVQLSPTLQATKSNYTRIHSGAAPKYLEYFQQKKPSTVLLDQLQSEQGTRFKAKRNRNIIIEVDTDIPVYDDFLWLTLGQIKELSKIDNVVNMDLRTVVSNISFSDLSFSSSCKLDSLQYSDPNSDFLVSANDRENAVYSDVELISWITNLKSTINFERGSIPLESLNEWTFSDDGIEHEQGKYFRINWVNVSISNREVVSWDQPIVEPLEHAVIAFLIKKINGVYHFLVQAKFECGAFDMYELGPTVSCIVGSYDDASSDVPYLDYVLQAKKQDFLFDTLQSEEGGRFHHEQNRTCLLVADNSIDVEVNDNYRWMTLNQLFLFLRFNNYVNIQARSILSMISYT